MGQVRLPWAEPHARFTALFERLAIDLLRETSVEGATRILRISWEEAWHILERAVARGLTAKENRPVTYLGVDEVAIARGHKYMTVVCDIEGGTVEHVAEDRKQESLDSYFKRLSPEQLAAIEGVAVDMWDPFARSILEHVPDAEGKIVYDRFHIMTHVGKAVDTVRKREHRVRSSLGDDTLKGSKYLWLYGAENLPEKHRARFEDLRAINRQTGRAWAVKESLRDLWSYRSWGWGLRHWKRWYFWATHSRLAPMIAAANLIKRHLMNVLTYFDHRITNATSEGINSKILTLKKAACGFRNREHFKAAIYFHCGASSFIPLPTGIPDDPFCAAETHKRSASAPARSAASCMPLLASLQCLKIFILQSTQRSVNVPCNPIKIGKQRTPVYSRCYQLASQHPTRSVRNAKPEH